MRTVIFDLDGTLADTSGDLIAAANACFHGFGHGDMLDPVADAATAFAGGRAMLRLGFERLGQVDEALINGEFPKFIQHYSDHIDTYTQLYPGAVEAVERLLTAGYTVGICTNKPKAQAEKLLKRLGIRELFASMIGADTLPTRKPDAAPFIAAVERAGGAVAQSMLVGDTVTDRDTAKAAGVPCLLVTFGPDGQGVHDLKPEGFLHGYNDLDRAVHALIG